jgi:hypothetical protein
MVRRRSPPVRACPAASGSMLVSSLCMYGCACVCMCVSSRHVHVLCVPTVFCLLGSLFFSLQDATSRIFLAAKAIYQDHAVWAAAGLNMTSQLDVMYLLNSGPTVADAYRAVRQMCIVRSAAWPNCFLRVAHHTCTTLHLPVHTHSTHWHCLSCSSFSRALQVLDQLMYNTIGNADSVNRLQIIYLAVEGCLLCSVAAG